MTKYLVLLFLLFSCGLKSPEKKELQFFQVKKDDFSHVINKSETPRSPDLTSVKTLSNRDYPIDIAIFNDGRFYYDLPNLDDGYGTWEFVDGKIKLHAQRDLFDINIDVVALKEAAEVIAIDFRDRFSRKVLEVEKINIIE